MGLSIALGNGVVDNTIGNVRDDKEDEDSDNVGTAGGVWMGSGGKFQQFVKKIDMIHDFCNGLQHQLHFKDWQMLESLQQEGASFLHLVQNHLSQEHHLNLTRGSLLTTWERATMNVMFYQTRLPQHDINS